MAETSLPLQLAVLGLKIERVMALRRTSALATRKQRIGWLDRIRMPSYDPAFLYVAVRVMG